MKTITEEQAERLVTLRRRVSNLEKGIDKMVTEAVEITGEEDESGYTFDYIRNNIWTVEELLRKVDCEVK